MIFVVKTKTQSRKLLNNSRLYQDATCGAKNMLACATCSVKDNAICGVDDLSTGMLRPAIMDSSVGECANAVKQKTAMYHLTGGMYLQSMELYRNQYRTFSNHI